MMVRILRGVVDLALRVVQQLFGALAMAAILFPAIVRVLQFGERLVDLGMRGVKMRMVLPERQRHRCPEQHSSQYAAKD
jgi:hypothetical protein